jgi:hypothetical protein
MLQELGQLTIAHLLERKQLADLLLSQGVNRLTSSALSMV